MPLAGRVLFCVAVMLLLGGCAGHSAPAATTGQSGTSASAGTGAGSGVIVTAVEARWRLPVPLSRVVVVPDGSGVWVAGGLTGSRASATAVYQINVDSGATHSVGALNRPVHDAAGASIAGGLFVFGGGAASTTAAVQRIDGTGAGGVVGRLPQPRSDLSAVTVGAHVYLLGGYTGSQWLAGVLDTTDGTTFHPVATLPVPVRYAAVATVDSTIWVFGGEQAAGPVRDIQRIDTTTGRAHVVGQLPVPLSQATALVLDGHVLIAGGRTGSTQTSNAIYQFDPSGLTVRSVAQLPMAVADAGSVVIDHIGYLLGGEHNGPVAAVQTLALAPAATSSTPAPSGGTPAGAGQRGDIAFDRSLPISDRGHQPAAARRGQTATPTVSEPRVGRVLRG